MKWPQVVVICLVLVGGSISAGGVWLFFRAEGERCVIPMGQVKGVSTSATPSAQLSVNESDFLAVDINGAIKKPGFYRLEPDSRLADLIEQAGGLSSEVDAEFVSRELNLAQALIDGDKIYIPSLVETDYEQTAAEFCQELSQNQTSDQSSGKISINTASQEDLESLPGIGEKRATDIIDQRPYQTLSELLSKEVVTESIYADIEQLITI